MSNFLRHAMKSKKGKERVQGKEKNLNKMRKIRILYSDPNATDYSSEEEDLFMRNEYKFDGSKRIVEEIIVPFMPLAYENKKNECESSLLALRKREDVKEVILFQPSPSSVLDVSDTDTKAAKDINDIDDSVKEINVKDLTGDEKRGNLVEEVGKEDISVQYLASLAGHDLYLDETEMLLSDGFCNLLDNDEISCGSLWKVENGHGSSCCILPHVDCAFNDFELGWIDETLNWDCQ